MRAIIAGLRHVILAAIATWLVSFAPVAAAQATGPNYTALWWNPSESGWGINITHQGSILFATAFTYQKSGLGVANPPLWLVMSAGTLQADGKTYAGTLYRTTGTPYGVTPFVPIVAGNLTQVGVMSVSFSSSEAGTVTYSVDGVTVTKSIVKQTYGNAPASCTFTTSADRRAATNYQDLWWNPAESGWGLNLAHQYVDGQGEVLFATLFVYGLDGHGLWLVMSSGKKQSDGSFLGELYQTTGSAFDANPFVPLTGANLTQVGTMRIAFTDGQTGTLTYTVNGVTVVKAITRQVYATPVFACTTVAPSTMAYVDKVYVTYVGAYPYSVTKSGVTKVTNRTQYTTGFFPLFNCSLYELPIESGIIPVQCTVAVGNARKTFYINPMTNELFEYTGTFAFDATKFHSVSWGTAMPYGNSVGTQGAYAEVADGIYWGPWSNNRVIKYSPKFGSGYDFNNVLTVAQETGIENFKVIIAYSYTPPASLSYTDKVYALWTAASPYAVTKTGVTPVINKTSYTVGNFPIYNCLIADKPLRDGKVLLDCQARPSLASHYFYIDPTKDEMYDYSGPVPGDITFTISHVYDPNRPEWGPKAKVSDGWYFTTFDVTWVLKFRYDDSGAIITVKEGTFAADSNIKFLASYSH